MTKAPIGVFDSGVGGLSILKSIHQLLPAEHLLYIADSAHAPYGPRGEAFIQARCEAMMQFFVKRGVKAVVLAC
jgi:glutamate racemase